MKKIELAIKELLAVWYGSKEIKRCVLCKSSEDNLDDECPVCRAIELLKEIKGAHK